MIRRVNPKMFAAVLCAAMLSATAAAQGKGHGQGNGQGQGKHEGDQRDGKGKHSSAGRGSVVFTTRDQGYVRDYYRNGSNLPPGLAKRGGDLPPGLRRQLQRNGTLPPGLQNHLEPLSADLERRLSPLPATYYYRGRVGPDVVIVDNRTQRIVDIIRDVLR